MTHARLVALGALVGIPAAAAAALFLGLVHELQNWLWTDLPDALGESGPPWYLVLGLPVVGAALVWCARTMLPGDGGHTPIHGIDPAPAPLSHAPGIVLAAAGTLGFGMVLGPEAPVVALGSIVAVALASFARLAAKEAKILATAGAFAAISALFGGPIVAGVMMTESAAPTLGVALVPALLPGFVAAAIGYVIFVGFGDWGGLAAPGLVVPDLPLYEGTRVLDLLVAVAVGVATAIVIAAVSALATGRVAGRLSRRSLAGSLVAGGLAVGLIALLADALGADSQDILFSGQHSISPLVTETSTGIVLLLLAAKAIAYAVSLVAGFRGGPIFPAVFLGIGVATLPVVWFDVSPTFAVAAGAAAGMAAYGRFVLTAMLFAALLVGSRGFDAIPGAVLAAAAAWITVTALDARLEERSATAPTPPR
ncbi:MAG TPA: chloride channel protein [Thermoleophilaceae bacterium]|nr:chloride channel protein [Thermoleophilaceae bacterium]